MVYRCPHSQHTISRTDTADLYAFGTNDRDKCFQRLRSVSNTASQYSPPCVVADLLAKLYEFVAEINTCTTQSAHKLPSYMTFGRNFDLSLQSSIARIRGTREMDYRPLRVFFIVFCIRDMKTKTSERELFPEVRVFENLSFERAAQVLESRRLPVPTMSVINIAA